ncbi:hypothetical protein PR048_006778 [Dryococelus australis]|uniref:Uncharacterized protein n=1 Tax=Dryococelus australis TaxID=614101 RepID=A0ABQ9IBW2_9NEOP|nr:hypothetical protein PR048_006778 [Dryococelus australis]
MTNPFPEDRSFCPVRTHSHADMAPFDVDEACWHLLSPLSMEQRRNERAGNTGDPRVNPPTNSIVRLDFQLLYPRYEEVVNPPLLKLKYRRVYTRPASVGTTGVSPAVDGPETLDARGSCRMNIHGTEVEPRRADVWFRLSCGAGCSDQESGGSLPARRRGHASRSGLRRLRSVLQQQSLGGGGGGGGGGLPLLVGVVPPLHLAAAEQQEHQARRERDAGHDAEHRPPPRRRRQLRQAHTHTHSHSSISRLELAASQAGQSSIHSRHYRLLIGCCDQARPPYRTGKHSLMILLPACYWLTVERGVAKQLPSNQNSRRKEQVFAVYLATDDASRLRKTLDFSWEVKLSYLDLLPEFPGRKTKIRNPVRKFSRLNYRSEVYYGVASECKGGENGRSPRNQRHDSRMQKSGSDPAWDSNLVHLVGRRARAAPSEDGVLPRVDGKAQRLEEVSPHLLCAVPLNSHANLRGGALQGLSTHCDFPNIIVRCDFSYSDEGYDAPTLRRGRTEQCSSNKELTSERRISRGRTRPGEAKTSANVRNVGGHRHASEAISDNKNNKKSYAGVGEEGLASPADV